MEAVRLKCAQSFRIQMLRYQTNESFKYESMKEGLKCVRIPELKYAHLCSESTNLSLRMTFSDSNMTLSCLNLFEIFSFTFDFFSGKARFVVVTCLRQGFSYYCQFSPKNLQISWS